MRKKRKIANNCEKATFMIEKKKSAVLSITDDLELKIHLAGCEACRIFKRQSKLIDNAVGNIFNESANKELKLDEQYKKELQQSINVRWDRT